MMSTSSQDQVATRRRGFTLRAALLAGTVLIMSSVCVAQSETLPPIAAKPAPVKTLPPDERAELLKIIRTLEERVEKLEAKQAGTNAPEAATVPAPTPETTPAVPPPVVATTPPAANENISDDDDDDEGRSYGKYTPNFGFKVVNTEYGDLNVSVYTYAWYLN